MSELYVMQKTLQPRELERRGLLMFDAWAGTFGRVTSSLEIRPEGNGYQMKDRFSQFHNLPELMSMFSLIADIRTADMLELPTPELKTGSPQVVKSVCTPDQKRIVMELAERAETIRNGRVDSGRDNFLKLTHEARLLSTDPRAIDPEIPDDPNTKLNLCAKKVAGIYHETAKDRLTQLIFCDQGTPKADGSFNFYEATKAALLAQGVKPEEISFIHDAKTDVQREQLFEKVRKDSCVLLDIARRVYPDIPAVFVDTGLEYPELREFVKTKENVNWLRPRYPFTQIIEKYGYPVISKEIADCVDGARKGQTTRIERLNGTMLAPDGSKSVYNCENYRYLLEAPFKISARCCYHMKKAPIYRFERETGRHGIVGLMAQESRLRTQKWLQYGCNGFERKRPLSQPMAFWLEQDILEYLKKTGIPYSSIYGEIEETEKKDGSLILKTTGVSRSGCMYCMFGGHLEQEPNRFQRMQQTHPKQYDYCINRLGCGRVLDFIGVPYRLEDSKKTKQGEGDEDGYGSGKSLCP